MTTVVVAGVSARAMAESARRGGFDVIVLDCFGDADTRAACRQWHGIAAGHPFEIDAQRFAAALAQAAAEPDVRAWIPGAGFESQPGAIADGAKILPMVGTRADDVRRIRDPRGFFAGLDTAAIAHPPVRHEPVNDPSGWLVKDAGGRGGWHVRPAATLDGGVLPAGSYLQREVAGVPMSATFLADGTSARLLGINRQRVRHFGTRRHVFCGVTGPIAVPPVAAERVASALRHLVPAHRLKGLGSLDFILDGDEVLVLEVNPRPPASFSLYEGAGSLIAAHLEACLDARLPPVRDTGDGRVRGLEIVYARRSLTLSPRAAEALVRPGCHDRPLAGSRFSAGDPVCSLSADGLDADDVEARLAAARDDLLTTLETLA